MTTRMNREQFFTKLKDLSVEEIKKVLWAVYWRGGQPVQERINALLDPEVAAARRTAAQAPPEANAVLAEVEQFVELAFAGAYLAGDRRVSPKERTRWRFTFRRLATDATNAPRGHDVDAATKALGLLIDLACSSRDYDYFRSEDPMEAARFVVSDVVTAIWARTKDVSGAAAVATQGPHQLLRWESRAGWTRYGFGWVSERETTLASKLAGFLTIPDLWTTAATSYLAALDQVGPAKIKKQAWDLAEWNTLLTDHLVGPEQEDLLAQILARTGPVPILQE